MNRTNLVLVGVVVLAGITIGSKLMREREGSLPAGLVSANGRIESEQVDVSANLPAAC